MKNVTLLLLCPSVRLRLSSDINFAPNRSADSDILDKISEVRAEVRLRESDQDQSLTLLHSCNILYLPTWFKSYVTHFVFIFFCLTLVPKKMCLG